MDPVKNPYAPGAGTPPPELAGRADVIQSGVVALKRVLIGKPSQSLIMVGLRGVDLLVAVAEAAKAASTPVALFMDELQYLGRPNLAL